MIYVGKAKNLRTRVRSYFYGDERRSVANMLQELHDIDYRACETEVEAEVVELRLIHAHLPRHNRRSKPARSPHWVKLTDERFPRLSVVRSYRDDGTVFLGPFRSKRSADLVVAALWDALPIRRCTGPPGKREGRCAFSQLGVALCPCAGDLSEAEYRPVVDRLIAGIAADPVLLLRPLAEKMAAHSGAHRFEEAGWVRDRYRALARAIERRHAWQALQQAGLLWAEDGESNGALIERGRLVAAWQANAQPPLTGIEPEQSVPQVPPSVGEAEEAHLVWRWLNRDAVRIVDTTSPLMLPASGVPDVADLVA